MDRRKALKMAVGTLAAGTVGVTTLATAFEAEEPLKAKPKKIELDKAETAWKYSRLDPAETAELAYKNYPKGSCMYGVFSSIVEQLAEKVGEPFASFPMQMMKYGHGGIGGEGTICGTMNGAAAVLGLLISNKKVRDAIVAELFKVYEDNAFPNFKPQEPVYDYDPPATVSTSVLCHVSTTKWAKENGFRIDSNERKERCRRLTADIAGKTAEMLNAYFDNAFVVSPHDDRTSNNCMACHGSKGKVANTAGKMNCNTCHEESVGHKLFSDVHYKLMEER